MKPYSESCDQNRDPIFEVLAPLVRDRSTLLEIGSGTGQHAVYFGAKLPHLTWQTSDRSENHPGIQQWLDEAGLPNVLPPLELDTRSEWPDIKVDAVFSANTTHIMHWNDVIGLFQGVGRVLAPQGIFILYGPFNYDGQYTSDSNRRFDQWLKQRDSLSGIRDFEALNQLANEASMTLVSDHAMPANNRILCWKCVAGKSC